MGSIRVPILTDQAFSLAFARIPDEAKSTLRRAFSLLAKLSNDKREAIVAHGLDCLEEGSIAGARTELKNETGLSDEEVEGVLGAVMLLASGVVAHAHGKPPEDVPNELAKANLLEKVDLPKIEEIFLALKPRETDIQARTERLRLASKIFPAYRSMYTAVDLRVESGEKRVAAVIGLVRFVTDENDVDIQFQITSLHAKKIIKRLQDLQREMDEAEKLAQVWEKK